MKKIYYVSTRDVADGIVNEATVIKETEKTYIAKIAGYERTLRKGDMKCGTIETFYAFEEYTDALIWRCDPDTACAACKARNRGGAKCG